MAGWGVAGDVHRRVNKNAVPSRSPSRRRGRKAAANVTQLGDSLAHTFHVSSAVAQRGRPSPGLSLVRADNAGASGDNDDGDNGDGDDDGDGDGDDDDDGDDDEDDEDDGDGGGDNGDNDGDGDGDDNDNDDKDDGDGGGDDGATTRAASGAQQLRAERESDHRFDAQRRVKDKAERATVEQVLDPRTRRILKSLLAQGILTELNGCVSTGKEANVYEARGPCDGCARGALGRIGPVVVRGPAARQARARDDGDDSGRDAGDNDSTRNGCISSDDGADDAGVDANCCSDVDAGAGTGIDDNNNSNLDNTFLDGSADRIDGDDAATHERSPSSMHDASPTLIDIAAKVFKTSVLVFRDRAKYLQGERRFRHGYAKARNPRKMVKLWAEKEYRNLARLRRAGVPCPAPLHLRDHVLLMQFIGERDVCAAPRLKDAAARGALSAPELSECYVRVATLMRRMYARARLVHGDLSEYNILVWRGAPIIIDVSQSTEHDHPHALDFLRRDCYNVTRFFTAQLGGSGAHVLRVRHLFEYITRVDERGDSGSGGGSDEHDRGVGRDDDDDVRERAVLEAMLKRLRPRRAGGITESGEDEDDNDDDSSDDKDGESVDSDDERAARRRGSDREAVAEREAEIDDAVFRHAFIPRRLADVDEEDVDGLYYGSGRGNGARNTIGSAAVGDRAASDSDTDSDDSSDEQGEAEEGEQEEEHGDDDDGDDDGDGDNDDRDESESASGGSSGGEDGALTNGDDDDGGGANDSTALSASSSRPSSTTARRRRLPSEQGVSSSAKKEWKHKVKEEQRERRRHKIPKKVKRRQTTLHRRGRK